MRWEGTNLIFENVDLYVFEHINKISCRSCPGSRKCFVSNTNTFTMEFAPFDSINNHPGHGASV